MDSRVANGVIATEIILCVTNLSLQILDRSNHKYYKDEFFVMLEQFPKAHNM